MSLHLPIHEPVYVMPSYAYKNLNKPKNNQGDIIYTHQHIEFCGFCKKTNKSVNLKFCNQCRYTKYCDKQCQKSDWKNHKETCLDIKRFGFIM